MKTSKPLHSSARNMGQLRIRQRSVSRLGNSCERMKMDKYNVRRVHIGKTAQLDELAHECGQLYSQTLVFFWRTVRHKGIWLGPKHLKRLFNSKRLHAHTADACVEAFFFGLSSWRERRKMDRAARPHTSGNGTSVSSTNGRLCLSRMGSFGSPTAVAMHRSCSIGRGNCLRRWSSTGQGHSTRP